MAQLFFKYSTMNAGKSTLLLQTAHNYTSSNMQVYLLTAKIDTRFGENKIISRLGIDHAANVFTQDTDILQDVTQAHAHAQIHCVLIDECQFLTKEQVFQLTEIVDNLGIPVLCYGLRTDFRGELFEGSKALLAYADKLEEIKTICFCGHKATHVIRLDSAGNVVKAGDQVMVGDANYKPLCRKHFKEAIFS